jgi:hypothetical protein
MKEETRGRKCNLDKFDDVFFEDIPENSTLTEVEKKQLIRYRYIFHVLLQFPWRTKSKLVEEVMASFGVSETQVYRDIQACEVLKGKVKNTAREFQQYKINSALDEAMELAIASKDPQKIAYVAAQIGKYNRLDKEDTLKIPIEDIIPPQIEFTSDPSVLGIEAPKEGSKEYVERILRKYTRDLGAETIEFDEEDEDE